VLVQVLGAYRTSNLAFRRAPGVEFMEMNPGVLFTWNTLPERYHLFDFVVCKEFADLDNVGSQSIARMGLAALYCQHSTLEAPL